MTTKLELSEYVNFLPEVREVVNEVVQRNMAEGIMFSAGTDTSIIGYEAIKYNPDLKALTVEFEHGTPKDKKYAKKIMFTGCHPVKLSMFMRISRSVSMLKANSWYIRKNCGPLPPNCLWLKNVRGVPLPLICMTRSGRHFLS